MDRQEAVMACVSEMRKLPRFASASEDQKAKAAAFAFDRLHEDALHNLPFGANNEEIKLYVKAATRRVHEQLSTEYGEQAAAEEFEQANGFPVLLVLTLIPLLWSWWKMLKEWLNW